MPQAPRLVASHTAETITYYRGRPSLLARLRLSVSRLVRRDRRIRVGDYLNVWE